MSPFSLSKNLARQSKRKAIKVRKCFDIHSLIDLELCQGRNPCFIHAWSASIFVVSDIQEHSVKTIMNQYDYHQSLNISRKDAILLREDETLGEQEG